MITGVTLNDADAAIKKLLEERKEGTDLEICLEETRNLTESLRELSRRFREQLSS